MRKAIAKKRKTSGRIDLKVQKNTFRRSWGYRRVQRPVQRLKIARKCKEAVFFGSSSYVGYQIQSDRRTKAIRALDNVDKVVIGVYN